MGRQRRIHRPITPVFPPDFPARLERFKTAGGFTWRSLARRLGVSPYRLREWRRGTVPSSTHLFGLLVLAGELGLMEILLYPDRDLSKESDGTRATAGSLIVGHVRTTVCLRQ
ncbi:MAG: hypothetical protein OXN91_00940 [Chloroflexota bacterium]|nr:hypothetical protein [Chloroflexota bacterium]